MSNISSSDDTFGDIAVKYQSLYHEAMNVIFKIKKVQFDISKESVTKNLETRSILKTFLGEDKQS